MIVPSTSIAFSRPMIFDGQAGAQLDERRLRNQLFTGENRHKAGCHRMDAAALRVRALR
jgi:hypothetical protein